MLAGYSNPNTMFKSMKEEDIHRTIIVKNDSEHWKKMFPNRFLGSYDLVSILEDSSIHFKSDRVDENYWSDANFDRIGHLALIREDTSTRVSNDAYEEEQC